MGDKRLWVKELLSALRRASPRQQLFPELNLAKYEALFR